MNSTEKNQAEMEQVAADETCCCSEEEELRVEEVTIEEVIVSLKEKLAEQTKLAEEYFNSLARVQADYDNFKRRTRLEKEDYYKYASEQVIAALLPVVDNYDRALAVECASLEDFKSGIEMIYRQLWDILKAEGLAPVPALGEPFDPQIHEAVLREESDEHPENTVVEELQRGYFLKDRLIRVAMVKITQ
jgi:molecular chaperone GrpE